MSEQAAYGGGTPRLVDAAAIRAAENTLSAASALLDVDPMALSADGLLEYIGLLGNIARLVEGRQVGNVGEISHRSSADAGYDGLAARNGAANATALFESITGTKNSTAYRYTRVAKLAGTRLSDTGVPLPAVFPHTQAALDDGIIGLDTAEALTTTLASVLPRAVPEELDAAEKTLVGNAIGANGDMPASADSLRLQARMFCVALDPDGAEPTAEEQHAARALSFRTQDDGMLRVSGRLSPEQAAIITPVFDAHMSPRTSPRFLSDEELAEKNANSETRSRSQERADVLTSIIGGAAKRDDAPTLHDRGPTVLVTVTDADLHSGTGAAHSPGTPEPLPISFVKQMQCDGGTRTVTFDEDGNVLDIGKSQRLFSLKQRLAMIARDGDTCAADDCPIPVWLAEAHHIQAWNGDNTRVSNGILLCWFHHRLIERGEWNIEIVKGRPRVVPPDWYVSRSYTKHRKPPSRE